jgi:hypothetical protein
MRCVGGKNYCFRTIWAAETSPIVSLAVRQFVLTDKFHQKRDEWLRVASDIISTPLEANRQSN